MARTDAEIGLLRESEIGDADALVKEAGWNQTIDDWRIFLELGTVFAIRDERDNGKVIATAATLPYGSKFGWISMVLIAGSHRRQGLATRLMNKCIESLTASGLVPILDATPAGRAVYLSLGFEDGWPFQRMLLSAAPKNAGAATSHPVERIADRDWDELCAYDARWFGADRSAVLSRLRGRLPEAELLVRNRGTIAGFLLGRGGTRASQIGPLVADDEAVAGTLLDHAIRSVQAPFYIDVLDDKHRLLAQLAAAGFGHERRYTRMMLRRRESFQVLPQTFAVVGPEFG